MTRNCVLIIDDDGLVRDTLARIATRLGYDAVQAEDGEKGFQEACRLAGRLALTLLDAVMPGPSGEETLARILSLGAGDRLVVMSGWSQDGLGDRIRDGDYAGVTFLRKPFSFAQIQELLPPLSSRDKGSVLP